MNKVLKIIAVLLGLLILGLSWPAYEIYEGLKKTRSEDSLVWEADIAALEMQTSDMYGPGEAVVFIGSSSIRFWNTLTQDMAPLPVIRHGFGGAKLHDIVHYADRLVIAYQPRAVVVFAGSNDIDPSASKSPQALLASYQAFVETVRIEQPDLPIFYIGITPSPLRWSVWPIAQATNRLIQDWVSADPNQYFIDTSAALMGSDGEPDRDNYRIDGLHLNGSGYQIWTRIVRQRLGQELGGF